MTPFRFIEFKSLAFVNRSYFDHICTSVAFVKIGESDLAEGVAALTMSLHGHRLLTKDCEDAHGGRHGLLIMVLCPEAY